MLAHAVVRAALRVPGFPATPDRALYVTLLPVATRFDAVVQKPGLAAHVSNPVLTGSLARTWPAKAISAIGDPFALRVPTQPKVDGRAAVRPTDAGLARAQAGLQADGAGARLVRTIRHASAPYFHYPLLARKLGWGSCVTIRLRVGPHGRLGRTRVTRSGCAVLGATALRSIRRITRLPDVIVSENGTAFDVLVPIVYRLTEN